MLRSSTLAGDFVAVGGGETAPVLLAVFAVAFALVTGVAVVPVKLVASNRFRPGLAEVVSPVSQAGLGVIDVSDAGGVVGGSLVERVRASSLAAYKHAYYNRFDLEELVAAVVAERGSPVDLDVTVNDRRSGAVSGEALEAGSGSSFRWVDRRDTPSSAFFLNVDGAGDSISLTLFLDTRFLAPADGEAVLRTMEVVAKRSRGAGG